MIRKVSCSCFSIPTKPEDISNHVSKKTKNNRLNCIPDSDWKNVGQQDLGTKWSKNWQTIFDRRDKESQEATDRKESLLRGQYGLGTMYRKGVGIFYDPFKAREWTEKSANLGHAGAQRDLGYFHFYGEGGPQDFDQAYAWLKKAADQDAHQAKDDLQVMITLKERKITNLIEAIKFIKANRDTLLDEYPYSYFIRGWYWGTSDLDLGVKLLKEEAERGDPRSQADYAVMLTFGYKPYSNEDYVVESDEAEAEKWFEKAKIQGFNTSELECKVGKAYWLDTEAEKWFIKAACKGHGQALLCLAHMKICQNLRSLLIIIFGFVIASKLYAKENH